MKTQRHADNSVTVTFTPDEYVALHHCLWHLSSTQEVLIAFPDSADKERDENPNPEWICCNCDAPEQRCHPDEYRHSEDCIVPEAAALVRRLPNPLGFTELP